MPDANNAKTRGGDASESRGGVAAVKGGSG